MYKMMQNIVLKILKDTLKNWKMVSTILIAIFAFMDKLEKDA